MNCTETTYICYPTLEQILDELPTHTYLMEIDRGDSLSQERLAKIFEDGYLDIYDLYDDPYDTTYYEKELRNDIARKYFDDDKEEADDFLEQFRDDIRYEIQERDASTPERDLLRASDDLKVRLTVFGNGDCMNSYHAEASYGGFSYQNDVYFSEIVDILDLNPQQLKKAMVANDIPVSGKWPNLKKRNPIVDANEFCRELRHNCGYAVNWVFLCGIDIDKYLSKTNPHTFLVPKGTTCGLFDHSYGSGSVIECTTIRDFVVRPRSFHKKQTGYPYIDIRTETKDCGYSTDDVFGGGCFQWDSVEFWSE